MIDREPQGGLADRGQVGVVASPLQELGTGQVHAETVLDAAIRVDRALIFIRTLNVIDGAEVVARRVAARRAKTGRSADKGGRSARVVPAPLRSMVHARTGGAPQRIPLEGSQWRPIRRALGVTAPVTSPTYTIGHRYEGEPDVSHLDLYRFTAVSAPEWGDLEPYFDGTIAFLKERGVEGF